MKKEELIEELNELDSVSLHTPTDSLILEWCTYSDYSGGLVEKANREAFMKKYSFLSTISGPIGTVFTFIDPEELPEESKEFDEFLEDYWSLEEYQCLDGMLYSRLQVEAENEAWDSWASNDFEDKLGESFRDKVKKFNEEHGCNIEFDRVLRNLFNYACNKTNTYFEEQPGGSCWIDIDKVVKGVTDTTVEALLWETKMVDLERAGQQRLWERNS